MKWFKHYSNAHQDEKIIHLMDRGGGIRAYGLYFLILELCASRYEGREDETRFTFRLQEIIKTSGVRRQLVLDWFALGSDLDLFSFALDGNLVQIEWPNIAKIRDKDTKFNRKRIAAYDRPTILRDKSKSKEKEKEKERVNKQTSVLNSGAPPKKPAPALVSLPPWEIPSEKLTKLVELWNSNTAGFTRVAPNSLTLTSDRARLARERLSEFPDLNYWETTLRKLEQSQAHWNWSDWKPTFAWFVKPDTHARINEGEYEKKKKRTWIDEELSKRAAAGKGGQL